MKMRGMLILGLGALANLTSCVSTIPSGGYGVRPIQFTDVVVPDGMTLRDRHEESFTIEVGSWRVGHLEYGGTSPVNAVTGYVLQRMPQHAWELIGDQAPNGQRRTLRFARGQYVAQYTIERRENLTMMIVDYSTEPPS